MSCLVASDALEADTLKALPLGHVARQIHGENELWLAIVLTHPAIQVGHNVQCSASVHHSSGPRCACLRLKSSAAGPAAAVCWLAQFSLCAVDQF